LKRRLENLFASYLTLFHIPPDAGVHPVIAANFRRNFIVNGLDSASWLFGASFISISAVLPVYARHITDSALVIGLIPALHDFLFFIPQLFLAPLVERLPRKYPLVLFLGVVERLPYLVLPFAALWFDGMPAQTATLLFILLMVWKAIGSGIVAIPWQEMIAKIIPVTHRGRFFGLSHLVGQFAGIGGAALAAIILARYPYPQNFALSFACGLVGIWLSFVFLALTKEPAIPVPPIQHAPGKYGKRLGTILRQNPNFRTYLVSRWFSYLGTMGFGFVAVFGVERFGLPDSMAAVFTGILYATGVIGYLVWGPLGDRLGHKLLLQITACLWIAALACVLSVHFLQFEAGIFLAFGLMGLSSSGGLLGDFSLAMEFGPVPERPTYIGLARALTAPALLIAPVLGGLIAQTIGYPALFAVSLGFVAVGLGILSWLVKDPRFIPQQSVVEAV
jgi:MFS family permease